MAGRILGELRDAPVEKTTLPDFIPKATKQEDAGSSLTCSSFAAKKDATGAQRHDPVLDLYERIQGTAVVHFETTMGTVVLELYCEMVPRTCHNFLLLVKSGYYDGTVFHRK